MSRTLSAFLCGLVFGLGLVVSQMVNPAKVLAFLDIFGDWDPSLALVMGAAVFVSAAGTAIARRRGAPVLAERFDLPGRRDLDPRLLGGAVLFGIGWGLVGLCPGPALADLALGLWQPLVFVAAMVAGMVVSRCSQRRAALERPCRSRRPSRTVSLAASWRPPAASQARQLPSRRHTPGAP